MIANLTTHPKMKDSGVEWLGAVPGHWEVAMIKRHYAIQLGKMLQTKPSSDDDIEVPYLKAKHVQWFHVRVADTPTMWASPSELDQYGIMPDDLLVCEGGEGGRCGILKQRVDICIIQNALHRVRPRQHNRNDFLQYVLSAVAAKGWFDALNDKATIAHFTREKIGSLKVPCPSRTEQTGIVRFLDHADRRIQRNIRAKQELIALLEEHKQAITHQAVTGQIDVRTAKPYLAYKPSGVQWVGNIPVHWAVSSLRHRYFQCLGKMLDTKRITGDFLVPYLRNRDVQWGRINTDDLLSMDIVPEEYARYTVQLGDLLVCEGGEVGRCAIWAGELAICGFQKALHRLRPRSVEADTPRFMWHVLRVAALEQAFSDGQISTIAHLTGDKLRAHSFPFPPLVEQCTIVKYLEDITKSIDAAVDGHRKQIELAREFRTVLIADVVTGRLDVRGVNNGEPLYSCG